MMIFRVLMEDVSASREQSWNIIWGTAFPSFVTILDARLLPCPRPNPAFSHLCSLLLLPNLVLILDPSFPLLVIVSYNPTPHLFSLSLFSFSPPAHPPSSSAPTRPLTAAIFRLIATHSFTRSFPAGPPLYHSGLPKRAPPPPPLSLT